MTSLLSLLFLKLEPTHLSAIRYGTYIYISIICNVLPVTVYTSSQDGQTPLLIAIRKKNIAIVSELVTAGADVNYMEDVSNTLFNLCVCDYTCILPEWKRFVYREVYLL